MLKIENEVNQIKLVQFFLIINKFREKKQIFEFSMKVIN